MNPVSESQPRRILVHRTGHLGDTICAIPAFRLVRHAFPQAQLTLLCDRPSGTKVAAADVVERLKIFDRVETYVSRQKFATLWNLARAVRSIHPDLILMLPQEREPAASVERKKAFFRFCGVPDVRGHNFPSLRHEWQPNEPTRLVQILHSIGIRGPKPGYDIPTDAASRTSAVTKLRGAGIDPDRPFLLFCGGGKAPTQHWDLAGYARVLKTLTDRRPLAVVALGSPEETAFYQAMLPFFPSLKIVDSLTLPEMFEVARLALAYVGNDTGPMHVAAAVGCPVAAVLSSRNFPGAWDPDIEPHLVVRHRTDCEGCFLTVCVRERHRCMTSISEERVHDEWLSFLTPLLKKETARS